MRNKLHDGALRQTGTAVRRKVLGAKHVERALAAADEFTLPIQEYATDYCWGAIWGRDGLSHQTRSLLNIAMLSVLGRQNELRTHVGGALRNGCSVKEIQEVLLQVAAYAGIPASAEAFRNAKEAIATYRAEQTEPAPKTIARRRRAQ